MKSDDHGLRTAGSGQRDSLYKSGVFLLLPVKEVLQIVHKRRLVQNALLR